MFTQQISSLPERHDASPTSNAFAKNASASPLSAAFQAIGTATWFDANEEIFGEGERAEYFYQVVTGAVRTYKVLSDGRRQIGAFHLPGDVFGMEAGQHHRFSAEAIATSKIRIAKRSAIFARAGGDQELATELWTRTADDLQIAQHHMLLLGRKSAEERVATFLLQLAERANSEEALDLPMSRQDMADYLGLTIETVSRSLTNLRGRAAIELPSSRHICLRDRAALQRLNA